MVEKTGKRKLLQVIKSNLEDLKVITTLKLLAILGADLSRAITVSQSAIFSMKEILIVEDAKYTLQSADELCKEILKPGEELEDDVEYCNTQEEIRTLVRLQLIL